MLVHCLKVNPPKFSLVLLREIILIFVITSRDTHDITTLRFAQVGKFIPHVVDSLSV